LNEEVWIVGRGKEGAVVISFPAMTVFANNYVSED
jgi:hypothetical protein